MVLLYLHQYFSLPSCAGGTRSYDLAKRFKNAGHKVIVLTSSAFLNNLQTFPKGWTVINYDGLELHVFCAEYSNKMNYFRRIVAFVEFLFFASARILKVKCDVVLATSTPITIVIPAAIKKYIHKTPYIFEVRDVWPEVPIGMGIIKNRFIIKFLNSFEKWIYMNASHIVPLSGDMRSSIIKRTGTHDEKLTVIPNISEIDRFSAFNSQESVFESLLGYKPEKVVLYAGTLGMVNGLKYMVDLAFCAIHIDATIKFLIFGDGMEKEELIKYAKERGVLNKNLYFLNPVPKSQLAQIYYESTVATSFVIPVHELWANSANKFFDCLAAGRPIVVNHGGWQAEVINTEGVGFVLDWDIQNMEHEAHRFCLYINNSSLLVSQGIKAKHLAECEYSLDIASERYFTILNKAVS